MLNSKCLPNHSSSSMVHEVLTAQGFKKIGYKEFEIYQIKFRDTSTQLKYHFNIPIKMNRHQEGKVSFGREYFEGPYRVPQSIREAAKSKLQEIADYLYDGKKIQYERIMTNGHRIRRHEGQKSSNKESSNTVFPFRK